MQHAHEIAETFRQRLGQRIIATAIYGSLARGADGPYSDIEMFVVVDGQGVDQVFEWSTGPWKAEVDVQSSEVFLAAAREFDEFWPITHGAYLHLLPLHDPGGLFAHAGQAARQHSDEEFRRMIAEVIVGDLYEAVGKLRNGARLGRSEIIAPFALDAARYGACLIGLHNRQVYDSGSSLFSESLARPGRPAGYDALARQVIEGDLRDPLRVTALVDAFWAGVEAWAAEQGIPLTHELEQLLDQSHL